MTHRFEEKVVPLIDKTYLAVIENSVGSRSFKNLYATVNGEDRDITNNGELSCAFFVSSILLVFGFIKTLYATVNGLVREIE